MDYAATTYTKPEVLNEMLPYFAEFYGNPSSSYDISDEPKNGIKLARERVCKAIGAEKNEIYFTNGGSEADTWALKGIALANKNKGNHIITSKIEHHAILHTCDYLEKQGFEVTYLSVDEFGIINLEELKNSIKETTILVSIMFVNNEIGTIEPIKEIGTICREKGIYFHTDAVQAIGHIDIDVNKLNIDLMSISGHKFYAPKGIGALYIRNGVNIDSLVHGGGQERSKRAGTENVPGIVGLGKAIEIATSNIKGKSDKLTVLRDELIEGLLSIPNTSLNGPPGESRASCNVNVSFEDINGESVLYASSGSACASKYLDPSHVLVAIGLDVGKAKSSIRFTLGERSTKEDIDYVIKTTKDIVTRLRKIDSYL
jgi:cysteine desulfurase